MSDFVNQVTKALQEEKWEQFEELWLDAIENETASFDELMRAARRANDSKAGTRVGSILALLTPQVETMSQARKREFYETLVVCMPKDAETRETLLGLYRDQYGDKPGFDTYVKTADLKRSSDPREAIQTFLNLVKFMPGTFVYHRSGWGVGEITEVRNMEDVAIIDFLDKPGHRVKIDAIPEICHQLADDDFRVLSWKNQDLLREWLKDDPCRLMKSVLKTSNRPLALARIRETLVGSGIIATGSWSKWWTKARAQVKKDPEIAATAKKTPEYFILEGPEGLAASIDRRLQKQGLKGKLRIIREALTEAEADADRQTVLGYIPRIRKDLTITDGPPELLLETLLFLKDNGADLTDLPEVHEILSREEHPGDVINSLGRFEDQKSVIDMLRSQNPEGWEALHSDLLLRADDNPRKYLIELLEKDYRTEEIDQFAREISRLPKKAPLYYLWMTRQVAKEQYDLLPSLKGSKSIDFYLKSVSLLNDFFVKQSHEPSTEFELYVKRYKQHLGGRPFKLLNMVVEAGDLATVRNVYRALEASPAFSSSIKQGLLAAVLRVQPEVLAGDETSRGVVSAEEATIFSTDYGIAKKRKELEEIRNEKLPEIAKLIGEALDFGDISENAELDSAREEDKRFKQKAVELEAALRRTQRFEPSTASLEQVSLGSKVTIVEVSKEERFEYAILGPWDGSPEDGVLSYMTPLGGALLDRKPGETVEADLPTGKAHYLIEKIEQLDSFKTEADAEAEWEQAKMAGKSIDSDS